MIITKLFNCSWHRRNKNTPATAVDIRIYNNKEEEELILFELYNRENHITHITLSKKQLLAVIQLNNVIKRNPADSTAKVPMLPDARGKPIQDDNVGTIGFLRTR